MKYCVRTIKRQTHLDVYRSANGGQRLAAQLGEPRWLPHSSDAVYDGAMNEALEIVPVRGIHGTIQPPGSKSITNRALVCAALADGPSRLSGVLDSDDTRLMVACLNQMGVQIEEDFANQALEIQGCGGKFPASSAELFVGNSGTTIRFLTAAVTLANGTFRLDGVPRMRERPIGDLVTALRQMNVAIEADQDNEFPPVVINADGLPGKTVRMSGGVSSQFLSGLLMAGPYATEPLRVKIEDTLVSLPYVDMTIRVMQDFGAEVFSHANSYQVSNRHPYRGRSFRVEADASAASYFWGAAAICGGTVTVTGIPQPSLQGDVQFCECLEAMGCEVTYESDSITVQGPEQLVGVQVNMADFSDTVPTLAVVATAANSPTVISNVEHIRHKETDRIGNLAIELRKLGATVSERQSGMTITPGPPTPSATIETYDDHRMAMSFALAGLKQPGVKILDPGCTSKTYPRFFEDLERVVQR